MALASFGSSLDVMIMGPKVVGDVFRARVGLAGLLGHADICFVCECGMFDSSD